MTQNSIPTTHPPFSKHSDFALDGFVALQAGQKSNNENLQTFLIIIKEHNDDALELGKIISIWLKNQGKTVFLEKAMTGKENTRELAKKSDIALVLGGDGTMLGVARNLYGISIPMLGINFGRVGFLTDISPTNWQNSLSALLSGAYEIQNYTPLSWELFRESECICNGIAMNDVVVARGLVAKTISISLSIDNIFLSDLYCDGLISSTALGATAYAASAHGPLVFPSLDAQILTPISPFAGAFPPLVLPKESFAQIQARKGGDTAITIDGQDCHPMSPNDFIHVRSARYQISMYVQNPHWFWQRLSDRGFIMPGPGKYTR